MVEQAMSEGY